MTDPRVSGVLPHGALWVPAFHWFCVKVDPSGRTRVFIGGMN